MKKFILATLISLAAASVPTFFVSAQSSSPLVVKLAVPYVSEAPGNTWFGSWKNACEEASIAMLQYFYAGKTTESIKDSKIFMQMLFGKEHILWGSDANSDTQQTLQLINSYSSFSGRIAEDPSINNIKAELDAGRPVIVPINGFTLGNKNIPFLPTGSAYHMFVIIGYDDANSQFIVNDTGDNIAGPSHRYSYDLIMNAMHDYNRVKKTTDGPRRAIFTFPKLAKTASSHRIYYLSGDTKQYVSHPLVMSQRGWNWSWVNIVSDIWLGSFKEGAVIRPK